MAITKIITGVDMKTSLNYGEIRGRIVKKTKTFPDVKTDVTDEAFYATARAIGKMQEPLMERWQKITTEDLIEAV